jgi:hypothetical protein
MDDGAAVTHINLRLSIKRCFYSAALSPIPAVGQTFAHSPLSPQPSHRLLDYLLEKEYPVFM